MIENKFYYDQTYLNIANLTSSTHTMGPGKRAAVWVMGCPFNCPSCYSPNWIPRIQVKLFTPAQLADRLLAWPDITGITISGGEPLLQSKNLHQLILTVKEIRPDVNFILYTGFEYASIIRFPLTDPRRDLISSVDVVIDGRFVESLNDNKGLRGSSNQKIIHITNRLKGYDFETSPRKTEIHIQDGEVHFVGVPDRHASRIPNEMEQIYVRAQDRYRNDQPGRISPAL